MPEDNIDTKDPNDEADADDNDDDARALSTSILHSVKATHRLNSTFHGISDVLVTL